MPLLLITFRDVELVVDHGVDFASALPCFDRHWNVISVPGSSRCHEYQFATDQPSP